MIVIDSSAVVALLLDEPDSRQYEEALSSGVPCVMSAFTYFEASVVLEARGGAALIHDLDRLTAQAGIDLIPFDGEHARKSRIAYSTFGKGYHPAALNLGDCVSYALAKALDAPLLFKGDDFTKTDVQVWRG